MQRLVSGIAFSRNEAVISLLGVPSRPGIEAEILSAVSDANIEIDMIAQNTSEKKSADFTFTVQRQDYDQTLGFIEQLAKQLGATVKSSQSVAKLSLVGIGMRSHTGVASKMFKALGDAGINIQMITTSEIKISVVIDESNIEHGARVIHEAFELDKAPLEESLQCFTEV